MQSTSKNPEPKEPEAKDAGPSSELQSPLAAVLSFECSSRFPSGVSSGDGQFLGSPVVPFYPFSFWVPLLSPKSRKKGALIIKGLMGNLGLR